MSTTAAEARRHGGGEALRSDDGRIPALRLVRSALPETFRHRLRSARDLARDEPPPSPLPTALAPLDRILAGGLARGCLTEIVGRRSTGLSSAVLAALAGVTASGEPAALVDLGDGLDPRAAATAGVDLPRLLWLRPRSTREGLAAAEIVAAGGFPLVVMDLGPPPVPGGKGAESAWLRLARCAREHRTALLVAAPYRATGPAAATVVTLRSAQVAWSGRGAAPRLLQGIDSRLELDKRRGGRPGESGRMELRVAAVIPAD